MVVSLLEVIVLEEVDFKTGGHILKGMSIDTKAITENLKRGGGTILDGVVRGVDTDRDTDRRERVRETVDEMPVKVNKPKGKQVIITEVDEGVFRATDYGLLCSVDGMFGEAGSPAGALKDLIKTVEKASKLRRK